MSVVRREGSPGGLVVWERGVGMVGERRRQGWCGGVGVLERGGEGDGEEDGEEGVDLVDHGRVCQGAGEIREEASNLQRGRGV